MHYVVLISLPWEKKPNEVLNLNFPVGRLCAVTVSCHSYQSPAVFSVLEDFGVLQDLIYLQKIRALPQSRKHHFSVWCLYIQQLDNYLPANFPLTVEVKTKEYADGHKLHNSKITWRLHLFPYTAHQIVKMNPLTTYKQPVYNEILAFAGNSTFAFS